MPRLAVAACIWSCALGITAVAQEGEEGVAAELRELRKSVEEQSRQIQALTERVQKLTPHPEAQAAAPATPEPAPSPAAASVSPTPANTTDAPKAVAVGAPAGPTHTVAKGETLTSIAKLYKVTISDLQKMNRIENDRTLQIGQTLVVPTPKPNEPPKTP